MLVTVDTGGTKTLIASFGEDGVMGKTTKFPTPKNQQQYTDELVSRLQESYDTSNMDALVVALPGRIDSSGILAYARHLGWQDFDLKKALEPHFSCPILVEHDASLAGLAAARQLETPAYNCLYVTVSTGIGTGLIIDNQIDQPHKQAEGGQIILEYNGELMYWEDFASGQAIKNEYGKFASEIDDPKVWNEVAEKLSRGFFVLIPLLRPDAIVIGGSIGTYFESYSQELTKLLTQRLDYVPPILAAKAPEQVVIYGCYYYAVDYLSHHPA